MDFQLMMGNREATEAAFAKAKHTVSVRLYNNRITANAMEPRACIGDFSNDAFTLYTSSQNPHGVRSILAGPVFKIPEIKLRVIAPDVGGGFGMKGDIYPEDGLVLWASRKLRRPVKWVATRTLSMDPVELRRRNYIPPSAMPYNTTAGWTIGAAVGWTYDSGDFARLTDRALELADWAGYAPRKKASEAKGRLRGRSLIYYLEDSGVFNERMELRFDPSGKVTIVAGTHSHGQGHATTYAQLVSDWLGVPFENVRLVQGDTDAVAFGRGTYASRSAMLGGSALKGAADAIIEKAQAMAAHLMEAADTDLEFKDGKFTVAGTDRSIALTDVAKAFYRPVGPTTKFGTGLDAS